MPRRGPECTPPPSVQRAQRSASTAPWLARLGRVRSLLVVPAASILFGVTIFPIAYVLYISLHRVGSRNLRGEWDWVGLDNYRQVLSSQVTLEAALRTAEFTIIVIAAELILGLLIALFLVRDFPGARFMRTLLLMPMLVTPIVVGLMWKALFAYEGGMVNASLGAVGIEAVPWLTNRPIAVIEALPWIGPWLVANLNANYGFLALVLIDIWQWTPFVVLIVISGLHALPGEVLEAARVDGAGYWQIVWRVTLPLLRPVVIVIVLLRTMDALKVYETVWALFGSAASHRLLNVDIITVTFRIRNYGHSAALSILVLLVVFLLSRLFFRTFSREDGYG
jgi:multiple sugar transport system permease protein